MATSTTNSLSVVFPAWTPGYYQIMDYGKNVKTLSAWVDGRSVDTQRTNTNSWTVKEARGKILLKFVVHANHNFVATSFIGPNHAYVTFASVMPMIADYEDVPLSITFKNCSGETIATALRPASSNGSYLARDFDQLYDSPVLIGNLKELPRFHIAGKRHRFFTVTPGDFDQHAFVHDLSKIVSAAAAVIGTIPYEEYTFLSLGPGNGGLEHLESTAFSFDDRSLDSREGRLDMLSFLGHEYFHNYNVKRIRPMALGPFDYTKENPTTELWISEGLTVYYDHMFLWRSGVCSKSELFNRFSDLINRYESDPGKVFQTLEDASYKTWSDGPFGNVGSDDRTISIYDKGAIIALFLDMQIINATKGRKNLDDLMRYLYHVYYEKRNRGFTKEEFRRACEKVAHVKLEEIFKLIETKAPIPYEKLLSLAGLQLKQMPDGRYSLRETQNMSRSQIQLLNRWLTRVERDDVQH